MQDHQTYLIPYNFKLLRQYFGIYQRQTEPHKDKRLITLELGHVIRPFSQNIQR